MFDPARVELVGDLDGALAAVGEAGTVWMANADWRVGWAVGAADRWHVAAKETAVRTRLIDGMPAVVSAMRVPEGDVLQRVAAVRDAAGRGVVLEFVNESSAPVSLALGVFGSISRAEARGSQVLVNGSTALELGRVPGGVAVAADGDIWPILESEPAPGDRIITSRSGCASVVVVVPLAVRTPLRTVLVGQGDPVTPRSPVDAAKGWRSLVGRAATADIADDDAMNAWSQGIAACILAAVTDAPLRLARGRGVDGSVCSATTAPRRALSQLAPARGVDDRGASSSQIVRIAGAAVLLDRVGLADEADRARVMLVEQVEARLLEAEAAVAVLKALASRRLRSQRVSALADLAGPLVHAAGDQLDAATLEQIASALSTEAPAAARDARRLLAETQAATASSQDPRRAAPAYAAPAYAAPAESAARRAAIIEGVGFGGNAIAALEALLASLLLEYEDRLVMMPVRDMAWSRGSVDVRSLVTRHGQMSFSLRWHGPLPAILWERRPSPAVDPAGDNIMLHCGLDTSWSSKDLSGEELLHQPPDSPQPPSDAGAGGAVR